MMKNILTNNSFFKKLDKKFDMSVPATCLENRLRDRIQAPNLGKLLYTVKFTVFLERNKFSLKLN